jgi:hypothetical protein
MDEVIKKWIVSTVWGPRSDPKKPYYLEWLLAVPDDWREVANVVTDRLTKELEDRVILNGFKAHNESLRDRGTRTQLGHVKMLTFTMAGRVMVTLHRDDSQVSFVYQDSTKYPPRMGLQSIECSLTEAKDIVKEACSAWEAGAVKDPPAFVEIDQEVFFG